ncbi:hypothetical protein EYF80_040312 [Liparis tanakae]|uniref:Uncharacterized protein n=1 Tax=Liparis tanakae TaxID=230148 RepID=A0A4Z2G8A4_9TELE|nr:hypothetical protein EYF80_040312 [Liparis tanakae]
MNIRQKEKQYKTETAATGFPSPDPRGGPRLSTRGCTQVICTFWSTSSMFPLMRPTDRAFITSSST